MAAVLAGVLALSLTGGNLSAAENSAAWNPTEAQTQSLKKMVELHQSQSSYLYHVFQPNPKPRDAEFLKSADWLKPLKAEMFERIAYRHPEEGEARETRAWQAPAVTVWELMQATYQLLPEGCGLACEEGFSSPPSADQIEPLYAATEERMRDCLERLSESPSKNAMGRHGKRMLKNYRKILKEIPRLRTAAAANDEKKLLSSIKRIGALTEKNYKELH